MNFLKKSIRKYWEPPQTYDVTELAKKSDVADEIEKALWALKGVMGLDTEEIEKRQSGFDPRDYDEDYEK